MVEAGYLRTDGRNFPLSRPLANAFDRQTGARPNPALGTPSGVYLTSEQTMVYNALQTSVRRRFANDLGLGFHYTYSRGYAEQGGSAVLHRTIIAGCGKRCLRWTASRPGSRRSRQFQALRHHS